MPILIRLALVMAFAANSLVAVRAYAQAIELRKDHLIADLRVKGPLAKVAWRFDGEMPAPLKTLTASINGRPLSVSSREYPADGDRTVMILLLDISGDAARHASMLHSKVQVVGLYGSARPHHVVALGSISDDVRLAISPDDALVDPFAVLPLLQMAAVEPNLSTTIAFANAALASNNAARRAAFIFTDGHSGAPIEAAPLIAAARASKTIFNFVVSRSGRTADVDKLKLIAEQTGGIYVEGEAADAFIDDPFRFVDSGATADISLSSARRYPWESAPRMEVVFDYGKDRLVLATDVSLPTATWRESALYLWNTRDREIMIVAASGGWLFATIFLTTAWRYKRRSRRSAAPATDDTPIREIYNRDEAPAADVASDAAAVTSATTDGVLRETRGPPEITILPVPTAKSEKLSVSHSPLTPTLIPILRLQGQNGSAPVDIELSGDEIAIGRSSANDIVLTDPTVSSRQARLIASGDGGYVLVNLSLTNPSEINGEAFTERKLELGDHLGFGAIEAEFLLMPRETGDGD
ncbi:FHA domain-containing protein [Sinorhizobium fredii]|uniref:FHA domain-containing protein n=1 Tax=Rhizobium fredii TaxID=380 RepID=UPI003511E8DD